MLGVGSRHQQGKAPSVGCHLIWVPRATVALVPFDIAAYFDALDQARDRRGLTWAALTRELNDPFAHRPDIPPIATSTLTGMIKRGGLNGNTVVHTLMWMGRSPEEFTPGHPVRGVRLPTLQPRFLPRWAAADLAAAVDAQRKSQGLTWTAAAADIDGYTTNMLRNVERSLGFPQVMGLLAWLGRPAADFVVNVAV